MHTMMMHALLHFQNITHIHTRIYNNKNQQHHVQNCFDFTANLLIKLNNILHIHLKSDTRNVYTTVESVLLLFYSSTITLQRSNTHGNFIYTHMYTTTFLFTLQRFCINFHFFMCMPIV